MNLTNFLIFTLFANAIANAENNSLATFGPFGQENTLIRNDDYLNAFRRQYNSTIQSFTLQIETFKTLYTGRLKILEQQRDLLSQTIKQIDNRLYPLELLSDFSKKCVKQHKTLIPPFTTTQSQSLSCISSASNQLYSLQSRPASTLRNLELYYRNTFEKLIMNCGQSNITDSQNYTLCITNAIAIANSYTQDMEKSFNSQIRSSHTSAESNIQQAVDCIFSLQNRTVSLITKASTLIERCVLGLDHCDSNDGYLCKNIHRLKVDFKNETLKNPLYGRNETVDCFVLDIL